MKSVNYCVDFITIIFICVGLNVRFASKSWYQSPRWKRERSFVWCVLNHNE